MGCREQADPAHGHRLLVLLTAANPNVRLLVKLAIGVLVALGVIEVFARPAPPKHRRAS
jgi:hypothetical protein